IHGVAVGSEAHAVRLDAGQAAPDHHRLGGITDVDGADVARCDAGGPVRHAVRGEVALVGGDRDRHVEHRPGGGVQQPRVRAVGGDVVDGDVARADDHADAGGHQQAAPVVHFHRLPGAADHGGLGEHGGADRVGRVAHVEHVHAGVGTEQVGREGGGDVGAVLVGGADR